MPKDFTKKMDIILGYWIYVNLRTVVNVIRNQLFFFEISANSFLHPVGGFRLPAPLWSYPRRQRQRALRLTVQCPVKLHRRNGHESYHTTWKKHICLFFLGQAFEVALSLGSSKIFSTLSLKIRIWKIVASKFCSARQVWTTWNTTLSNVIPWKKMWKLSSQFYGRIFAIHFWVPLLQETAEQKVFGHRNPRRVKPGSSIWSSVLSKTKHSLWFDLPTHFV